MPLPNAKMKIDKENNQYYGQFIEEAINSIINQTEIKNTTNLTLNTTV